MFSGGPSPLPLGPGPVVGTGNPPILGPGPVSGPGVAIQALPIPIGDPGPVIKLGKAVSSGSLVPMDLESELVILPRKTVSSPTSEPRDQGPCPVIVPGFVKGKTVSISGPGGVPLNLTPPSGTTYPANSQPIPGVPPAAVTGLLLPPYYPRILSSTPSPNQQGPGPVVLTTEKSLLPLGPGPVIMPPGSEPLDSIPSPVGVQGNPQALPGSGPATTPKPPLLYEEADM
ncbi:unnamed protein product [Haemonchus placei]|uniref:Uncharacterized protein n=1 Tax=Haemonchus placei TaxID=6290 RepID=A0A3P7XPA7_HAEPC|nr:unnamed protein product [Haemonchus placei]